MASASPYRPEFEAALRLFARVSEAMYRRGLTRPILVGGAAAEFYSSSALTTGELPLRVAFGPTYAPSASRSSRRNWGGSDSSGLRARGRCSGGWSIPISRWDSKWWRKPPMHGGFDRDTLALVDLDEGAFVVISVEDLIADRMGQYVSGTAPDRLAQARALFALQPHLDRDYLARRIGEETVGEYGIEVLED